MCVAMDVSGGWGTPGAESPACGDEARPSEASLWLYDIGSAMSAL